MTMVRIGKKNNVNQFDAVKPQLTSLVDVLTVLLIFLIRSFSAEGSPVNPVAAVTLPTSSSKEMPRDMASIEITPEALQVNGMHVATVNSIVSADSMQIEALYEKLTKNNLLAKKQEVMIQADKKTEFEVIKKVMYTCSKAGASDYTVLVVNEE